MNHIKSYKGLPDSKISLNLTFSFDISCFLLFSLQKARHKEDIEHEIFFFSPVFKGGIQTP